MDGTSMTTAYHSSRRSRRRNQQSNLHSLAQTELQNYEIQVSRSLITLNQMNALYQMRSERARLAAGADLSHPLWIAAEEWEQKMNEYMEHLTELPDKKLKHYDNYLSSLGVSPNKKSCLHASAGSVVDGDDINSSLFHERDNYSDRSGITSASVLAPLVRDEQSVGGDKVSMKDDDHDGKLEASNEYPTENVSL